MENEATNPPILVAEDNAINQVLITRMLTHCGYSFVLVSNGAEAVAAYEEHKPSLVLMDVQMPVMDGLQATMEIRRLELATGTHTPIVAVTARALAGDEEKCLGAGMDDYISKPLRFQAFADKLNEWLGKDLAA
jgi:CheY-like chemotaxis protein